jgi:hypothetical protein
VARKSTILFLKIEPFPQKNDRGLEIHGSVSKTEPFPQKNDRGLEIHGSVSKTEPSLKS